MLDQITNQIKDIKNSLRHWLNTMQVFDGTYKMANSSVASSLDATSLAIDLKQMIGDPFTQEETSRLVAYFNSRQIGEWGFYYEDQLEKKLDFSIDRVKEMHGNYLTFQVVGALKGLDVFPKQPIRFYDQFIQGPGISHYLDNNCPWERSPWGAGGMVDNLGTILDMNIRMGREEYRSVLEQVFDWLDLNQDSKTGLWGTPNIQGLSGQINGAYHLMRGTYCLTNKEFNCSEKIISSILENIEIENYLKSDNIHGCYEMDHSVVLEKALKMSKGYRLDDVQKWAKKRIFEIIDLSYCKDGGFSFFKDSSIKIHNYIYVSQGEKEADMVGSVFFMQSIRSLCEILGVTHNIKKSVTHG